VGGGGGDVDLAVLVEERGQRHADAREDRLHTWKVP
jgi:hypothetical protein